ncbi:MAG: hypothetical protein SFV22_12150, partial [Saprospiraceae bacterium]|nr:hypothetical protein [Saprospiraceae bacterium]
MKSLRTATPWLLLLIVALLANCNKDKFNPKNHTGSFDWTLQEAAFFELHSQTVSSARDKSVSHSLYHPLLLQARQRLIQENEDRPFVQAIVNHTGLPVWSKSYIYCNTNTKDKLVIIPLASDSNALVTGFISLYKKDDGTDADFIINGMSRSELLDTTSGNSYQRSEYVKFMMKYDKMRWIGFAGQITKRVLVDFQRFLVLSFFRSFRAICSPKMNVVVFDCST